MRLVRHLVRHDLTADAKMLIVWVLVLALQSTVLWIGPPEPVAGMTTGTGLDTVAIILRLALTVVLVPAVVHRQPLVGTVAFWRTRPIPRAGLLAAKALFIGIAFVGLPLAWFLVTFLGMGLPSDAAAGGAVAVALEQALIAGLSWALASVTATLAQFVVGMLATALITIAGRILSIVIGAPKPFVVTVTNGEFLEPALFLLGTAMLVLMTVQHHLSLKASRSRVLLLLVLVLSSWTLFARPWRGQASPPGERVAGLPAVEPGVVDLTTWQSRSGRDNGVESVALSAIVRGAPTSASVMLRPIAGSAVLDFGSRGSVDSTLHGGSVALESLDQPVEAGDQPYAAMTVALGVPLLTLPSMTAQAYRPAILQVPKATHDRLVRDVGALEVRLLCEAVGYQAAQPARPGRSVRIPHGVLRLDRTERTREGLAAYASETKWTPWVYRYGGGWGTYVLRHTPRSEAVLLSPSQWQMYRSTVIVQRGVVVTRLALDAAIPADSESAVAASQEWLGDSELVRLDTTIVGKAEWTTRAGRFTLQGFPRATVATEPVSEVRR